MFLCSGPIPHEHVRHNQQVPSRFPSPTLKKRTWGIPEIGSFRWQNRRVMAVSHGDIESNKREEHPRTGITQVPG